jgi:hypothetical protein
MDTIKEATILVNEIFKMLVKNPYQILYRAQLY